MDGAADAEVLCGSVPCDLGAGVPELLEEAGLDEEEAFLIGVKRLGELDTLSREFAREHSERLWKRMVVADASEGGAAWKREALVALGLAVAAALAIKVPELFGLKSHGVILASVGCIGGIGSAIGAPMAGYVFDVTGSYKAAFMVCAILGIIGLTAALALRPTKKDGW